MLQVKQSSAVIHFVFLMVDSTDHVTGKTGLTPTVTISKNAAAFASPSGAVTEISGGWYKLAANATDSNTLGVLALHATGTAADPTDAILANIVAYDPQDSVRAGLTALPNAAAEAAGGLYTRGSGAGQINQPANGQVDANAVKLGGTTQTGRDIGASVLLSSGTGTGQLDFTSGVVKANLAQILGTALTETAGQIAAGFKKVFDVASPVFTAASVNQTGDSFARLGAPAGASVSADVAAIKSETATIKAADIVASGTASAGAAGSITLAGAVATDSYYNDEIVVITGGTGAGQARLITGYTGSSKVATVAPNWTTSPDNTSTFAVIRNGRANLALWLGSAPNALQSGRVDSYIGAVASGVIAAASFASGALDAVWSTATRVLTAGTNIVLAKGTGVTGFNDLDAAGVRSAVGLASANLDTQIAAVQSDTDNIQTRLPAALVSGRMDASVGAMAAGVVTAAAIAADAITAAKIADGAIDAATFAGGAINAAAIASDTGLRRFAPVRTGTLAAATASTVTLDAGASAVDNFYDVMALFIVSGTGTGQSRWTSNYDGTAKTLNVAPDWQTTPDNTSVFLIASAGVDLAIDTGLDVLVVPSVGQIWEEPVASHSAVSGSMAEALAAAGGAGDPWITALPGSYSAGQAGYIVGHNLDAPVSGAASPPSAATIAAAVANEALAGHTTAGSLGKAIADIDGHTDTEIAAIKAKTDNLPASPAAVSDIPSAATIASTVWDKLLSGITTASSIGKLIKDNLDAAISSRLATSGYTAPLDAAGTRSAVGLASANLDTQLSAITSKTTNLPASPAAVSDIPTANQNADALLKRDMSAVTGEAARSPLNALRFLRNKWSVSGGTLTVKKEDDSTTAWTGAVTTTAGNPVSEVDPA